MTYNWIDFNYDDAVGGTLVGFQQTDSFDLSKTGLILNTAPYKSVRIDGVLLKIGVDGKVIDSTPSSDYVGKTLQMVTTTMGSEGSVGSSVTRSSGSSGEGHSATAVLSTMEPRDHFAMNALNSMLVHMTGPESKDDATMLMFSRSAYKWAQAMMIAAADSREGTSEKKSSQADVNANDLQSNSEKVLYNINETLKEIKKQLETSLGSIDETIENLQEVPEIKEDITIKASIFKKTHLRLEFATDMAYSDISVFFELAVKKGETSATQKIGYIIPKGTVTVIESLDDNEVTEISSITSATVRGQRKYDPNTYVIQKP